MALIIVGIILTLLVLILLAPAKIKVSYKEEWEAFLSVLGRHYILDFSLYDEEEDDEGEEGDYDEGEELLGDILTFREKIELIKKLLSKFLKYSRKMLPIKKLDVNISYGTDDAAATAILVGSFWAGLYGVLPLLDQVFRVKDHNFSVNPVYNQKVFSAEVEGIIKTRLFHIIFIRSVLLIQIMRYKNKKGGATK